MSLVETICCRLGCFYFLNGNALEQDYRQQALKAIYRSNASSGCRSLFIDLTCPQLQFIFQVEIKSSCQIAMVRNTFYMPHVYCANSQDCFFYCLVRQTHFWFVVTHWTDSAVAAAAAVVEKMIMVYNQELFWCNGVPTKHDKALKWVQILRGCILPTNKPGGLAASLPMAISHLHVSCAHSPVGLLLT